MVEKRAFLTFFKDKGCLNPVRTLISNEIVDAGKESEEWIFYARNITGNELLNISIKCKDKDVKIFPAKIARMEPHDVRVISFKFMPALNRKSPLSAGIDVTATEVRRPRW